MAIITISRQAGSSGTEIAQAVATRLQYEYLDKEKIEEALVARGLPMPQVQKFDEKKPPFWVSWQIQSRQFLHLIQMVIFDYARRGNIVIVGRGGQILMRDLPGVLHLRVVAPFSDRVRRIAEQENVDEKHAVRMIRRNDRDSAGYVRFFFDEDWEDPTLYDLVLNTRKISMETAVGLVATLALSSSIKGEEKETAEKLTALALRQKIEAVLLDLVGMNLRLIQIQIHQGVVTLKGSVVSESEMETCRRAIAAVEGVVRVDNQLTVGKFYPYGI
jgi:cytidylate kinase